MGFLEEDLLEAEKNKSKTGVALARRGMTLPRLKRWEEPGCEGLDVALQTFSLYFCQMKKGGGGHESSPWSDKSEWEQEWGVLWGSLGISEGSWSGDCHRGSSKQLRDLRWGPSFSRKAACFSGFAELEGGKLPPVFNFPLLNEFDQLSEPRRDLWMKGLATH